MITSLNSMPPHFVRTSERRCRWVSITAALLLGGSLFLPWFAGVDEGSYYTASGWSAFDLKDVLIATSAAMALLSTVAGHQRSSGIELCRVFAPLYSALLAGSIALSAGVMGHADHDPTLRHPQVGLYLACAASCALAASSATAISGRRYNYPVA